jgi:hypothetical protein
VHGIKVTGGSFPAQIWQTYMKVASAAFPKNDFPRPQGLTEETYCQDSGGKATQYCPKTATGLFLTAKLPADCPLHKAPTTVTVPNLIGMTKDAAIAALQKLALLFKIIEKDVKGATPGSVTDQDVKAGSSVPIGATVGLTVATAGPAKGKPPVAAFTWTPKNVKAGAPILFDASTSTGDTPITKYVWEFDAGQQDTTSGKTASYTFKTVGWHDVTLWVTDSNGQTTSLTMKVQVQ